MTGREFNANVTASIAARMAAEPVLAPCVCGADDEPDIDANFMGAVWIDCPACDRGVVGPTRASAIELWQRCMGADK